MEHGFFLEQLSQDAAAAPDVDGGTVPLLAKQQLGRSVPQRDDFVRVRPLLVLGAVQAGEPKISEFDLSPGEREDSKKLEGSPLGLSCLMSKVLVVHDLDTFSHPFDDHIDNFHLGYSLTQDKIQNI